MMTGEIFQGLAIFISENPMVAIGLLGIFIAFNSLIIARWQKERVFYEILERTSTFQITENLKNIERILNQNIGANPSYTLQDVVDGKVKPTKNQAIEKQLSILAPYFSEFCSNLDKYSANIMRRKKICFNFQEYGKKARKYFRLFKHYEYKDIGIEYSILHLKSAGILTNDE